MRNLMLAACVLAATVSTAQAGGYVAPAVEAAPVVAASPTSNPILAPIIILLLVGLVYATSNNNEK